MKTSGRLKGLKGKTALITGGSAGIGRASSILLAREGARVAITGRNEERGREVVREIDEAGGEANDRRTLSEGDESCNARGAPGDRRDVGRRR